MSSNNASQATAVAAVVAEDFTIGPTTKSRFDFTLRFEHLILSILPSCLFLFVLLAYLYHLFQKPVLARSGLLLPAKVLVSCALIGVEIGSAVLWKTSNTFNTSAALTAASLSCVAALGIAIVLFKGHRSTLRSPSVLPVYLTVTLLFDAVKARSCFDRPGLGRLGALAATAAALKLAILLLDEISRRGLIQSSLLRASMSPEATSGFWSRILFLWLNSTLFLGFRNILSVDDLRDMGPEFDSENLHARFQAKWATANKSSKHCLITTSVRTLPWPFLKVVVPRLCYSAFKFSQPLLFRAIIKAVAGAISDEVSDGLIGATAVIYFGMAVTRAYYTHLVYRSMTMLRGSLVSSILDKTLRLKLTDAKKAAAMTLISADIDGIQVGLVLFHDMWASVIELAVGIYMLASLVGGASFMVAIPATITTVVSILVAKRMGPARMAWVKSIQQRVAATTHILGQLKGVKMIGLAPAVANIIQKLRITEVSQSKKLRVFQVILFGLAGFSTSITPVVVIAGGLFWTSFSDGLAPAEVFTTLSIISLVATPLSVLLVAFPQFMAVMASFTRIQNFLLLDEQVDIRTSNDDTEQIPQPAEICDLTVGLSGQEKSILSDISATFQRSTVTMVLGPVGSGKSTLLKTLIGETDVLKGMIRIDRQSISYCDQSPWIRNATVKNNVVAENAFDDAWYRKVLHACHLEEDIARLPDADETLAGSNGINLSGGQKQRIALARAVYSRKSILVLDDISSALDKTTSTAIHDKLFGNGGIVRKSGATVIIATHSSDNLAVADQILTLDSTGRVSNATLADCSSFAREQTPGKASHENSIQGSAVNTPAYDTKMPVAATNKFPTKQAQTLERQNGDASIYYFYIKANGTLLFIAWLFIVALSAVWQKMPSIFVRLWLEIDQKNNTYFAGFATISATSFLCSMGMLSLYMMVLVPSSAENLHWMLLDTAMSATLGFLSSTDTGTILNRFSQDMTLVNQLLPKAVSQTVIQFFVVLVDIGVIASGASYAAAIIPLFIGVLYFLQKYYLRTSRQMRLLDLEAKSPLYTQLAETATGVQHIRAFGWQAKTNDQSLKLLDYSQKPYYYMFCIQRWLTLVLDSCVTVIAIVLVTLASKLTQTTTQSAIGLALLNIVTFSEALSQLLDSWVELETSLGAVARLKNFIATTPQEPQPKKPRVELPTAWPQQGKIQMNNVAAAYNSNEFSSRLVLDNVSVDIQPGQKVGVVGRTGSGKSSLVLTMLHLLDYTGSVVIDGVDISQISRQELRSRVTTLPQDPVTIQGSVRDNANPFEQACSTNEDGNADDSIIKAALARVGLLDHIESRGGLDSDLAKLGLSQGQMQLFCLARAILHNQKTGSRVVLMDEATSNVDEETDRHMQGIMKEAFAGCTVIIVAHRLDTIKDADLTVELDAGKIVRE